MKTKNSRRIRRKWPQLMRLTPLLLFLNKWGIDRLVFKGLESKRLDFKKLAVKELDFKRLDYEGFMVKEICCD